MHAFDFILVLFSFVYAAAVTHVLSTAGAIIIASKRIRLSWFNTGWMLVALLFTCAWWIGLWDLQVVRSWDIGSIAFYFSIAAGIYLNARLVSPRIPETGEIDLQRLSFRGRPEIPHRLHNSLRDHGGDECQAWPIRRRVAVAGAEYRYRSDDHSIGRGCNFH
jgi:hypothetical protein